ncbi:hypothetical protein PCANB_000388 [Pneumocystis canis]|nr:hypothetical protein PCK1_000283 [Pneumocystis canis]KAG5438041.1 hypothetical protein PCANB_000388 [Pneumocystis canis]
MDWTTLSYEQRAILQSNELTKRLLLLMARKQTNLCVAADFTRASQVLDIARHLGPLICILKTHVDAIEDFDMDFIQELQKLSKLYDFFIFEDRKFADIGRTAQLQYTSGLFRIIEWADLIDAHILPGDGLITALQDAGLPYGRGLLLIAEMSTINNCVHHEYVDTAISMARDHSSFVLGLIAQKRRFTEEDFIWMMPGIGDVKMINNNDTKSHVEDMTHNLDIQNVSGDVYGQQYCSPEEAICNRGIDIIIVGRNICASQGNIVKEAQRFRDAGWKAYLSRIKINEKNIN